MTVMILHLLFGRNAQGIALGCSVALITASCGRNQPGEPQMAGIPVSVSTPLERSIALTDIFTGRFKAVEHVEVRARVSGYLESVHFKEGEPIEEGALMFQLDARPFQAILASAEARVQSAKAARDLAGSSLNRSEAAAQTEAISKHELEIRRSERDQAEAEVLAAEAARDSAALDVEFTRIRAPISGIAGHLSVTRGNYISGGSSTATLLTTIVPHDPIYCYFEADEQRVLKFTRLFFQNKAPGRGGEPYKVEIAVSDSEEFEFEGVMTAPENQLDEGTATMQLRALVDNPDSFLTPGLFARVKVPSGPPEDVLLVRDSALGFDQSKRYAWIVGADDTVERRFVDVGRMIGGFRVVESGLTPGDRIALTNIQLLRPGTQVIPTGIPMDPEVPVVPSESPSRAIPDE